MKRKIFEKQIIDFETGEITSITTVTAAKMSEEFFMGRTTENLGWLYELSGNEIKALIYLLDLEPLPKGENRTDKVLINLVPFGPTHREELQNILGCSPQYLRRLMKGLESKAWLIRINKSEIVLNPKGFYKGASKDVLPRIKEFERVYASKKPE